MESAPRFKFLSGTARAALAAAVGVMLFFTFGVAPGLFGTYPRATAGEITGVLFPAYYHFLYATLGVALLSLAAGRCGIRGATPALILAALALGAVAAMDLGIGPVLDHLRGPGDRAEFARWHGFAMLLNLAAMIVLGVACALPRAHVSGDPEPGGSKPTRPAP